MKYILKFVFGFVLSTALSAKADLYTAENVIMSGEGTTPVEAKSNAIRQGELEGFTHVITGLIGSQNDAFVERPTDEEILEMVRDISILEEKKTSSSYWGKMNVRFKEESIQEFLKKNNQAYLKKEPPVYWLIPIWQQGTSEWTLEDENPFYQILKTKNQLSDFFQIILPNGDVDELIRVNEALQKQDFSDIEKLAAAAGANRILIVEVVYTSDKHWEMHPVTYQGTENIFENQFVQGQNISTLWEGWQNLNTKMTKKWQEEYLSADVVKAPYYARFNVKKMSEWADLEKELKKLSFIEKLTLQGATPNQLLLKFTYADDTEKLKKQLNDTGFIWIDDFGTLGTLKRKETDENNL